MIEVAVALIGSVGLIGAAIVTAVFGKKLNETHKQVTQNSHQNDRPTVLDLISEVRDEQRETNNLLHRHLEWHIRSGK